MSTPYFSWTFLAADPASFGRLPRRLGDDEAMALMAEALNAPPTASRNDCLHVVLGRLRDQFGGQALDFLLLDPESPAIRTGKAGNFLTSALLPPEVPAAMKQIDAWMTAISTDPERLATIFGVRPEVVRDDLSLARRLHAVDEEWREDGDRPIYLLWFLQELRVTLAAALASGETVVHVHYITG